MKKSELIKIIKEVILEQAGKPWNELGSSEKVELIKRLTSGELTNNIPGIGQVSWINDVGMDLDQFVKDYRSEPKKALKILDDLYTIKSAQQPDALDKAFGYADKDIGAEIDRTFGQDISNRAEKELARAAPDLGEPEKDLHQIANSFLSSRIKAVIKKNIDKIAAGQGGKELTNQQKLKVQAVVRRYYAKYTDGVTLVDDPESGEHRIVCLLVAMGKNSKAHEYQRSPLQVKSI